MYNGLTFFYGFEVRMGVGGAVVFLLYFFQSCTLYFVHIASFLLFVILAL
jgi:hypothetical protein